MENLDQLFLEKLEQQTDYNFTREKEVELFKRYKLYNDQEAYYEIINSHLLWLVKKVKTYEDTKVPIADLFQETYFGLIEAIKKFDYTSGTRFKAYAFFWIKKSVDYFFNNYELLIRFPAEKKRTMNKINRTRENLMSKFDIDNFKDEFLSKENIKEEQLESILDLIYRSVPVSLDEIAEKEDEFLSYDNSNEIIMNITYEKLIQRCFSILMPREIEILKLRFGLDGNGGRTLADIGQQFGVTGECVRDIQRRALRKIRREVFKMNYSDPVLAELDQEGIPYHALGKVKKKQKRSRRKRDVGLWRIIED